MPRNPGLVDIEKASAEFREAYERKHATSSRVNSSRKRFATRSIVQRRLSIYDLNPVGEKKMPAHKLQEGGISLPFMQDRNVFHRCPHKSTTSMQDDLTKHSQPTTQRVGALSPMPSCLNIGGHTGGSRQGHPRYTSAPKVGRPWVTQAHHKKTSNTRSSVKHGSGARDDQSQRARQDAEGVSQ